MATEPTYRLAATLAEPQHGLPRMVARLHALGAVITSLHVEDLQVRATVQTSAGPARLQSVVQRGVDVRLVTVQPCAPVTTTYVVLRQDQTVAEGA